MKTIREYLKSISYFLIILMIFQINACKYYKVDTAPSSDYVNLLNIGEIHKYFIIHAGDNIYALKEILADTKNISGKLEIAHDSIYYSEDRKYRYRKSERNILDEVHIYLNENLKEIHLGYVEIPITDINEIRIIEHNTGKTIAIYALVAVGALVIVAIIVAATKSSCPYIYVNDGETFVFEGETFGGAIAQNLERDDYMPLPSIKPNNGNYKIRISNELKERQYTDLAQLIIVEHFKDQTIILDKSGNPQLITDAKGPIAAISDNGANILSVLQEKDKNVHLFNDENYSKNSVIMKFKKPMDAKKGKLVLNGKNTLWFDYLFGEFLSKFGENYDNWIRKEAKISKSERYQKILDNGFPLSVYIMKKDGWQLIDYLFTVGPLASRDFVIPVDMNELPNDEVKIKVETGFMFWELDYATMDFTENSEFNINILKPSLAMGTGSQNWTPALTYADENYMVQENIGEVTELIFKTPLIPENKKHSVFLHTRGYYELIRDFTGLPDILELTKFKDPGYFSEFSRNSYLKVLYEESEIASTNINQ